MDISREKKRFKMWFLESNVNPALGYQTEFEKREKKVLLKNIAEVLFDKSFGMIRSLKEFASK